MELDVSPRKHTRKNPVHWSEGTAKAGEVRHERLAGSKEDAV